MTGRILCCLLLGPLVALPAQADTTIEYQSQGGHGLQRIVIKGHRMLMQTGERDRMLYDDRARAVTVLDDESRRYFVLDQAALQRGAQSMQQMQQQMAPAMQQMREQFEAMLENPGIPQAQKDMIRQQMQQFSAGGGATPAPGAAPVKLDVKATGQRLQVAGIDCRIYVVTRNGKPEHETCVAEAGAAGVPDGDYQVFRNMFAFMREMAESSAAAIGMQRGPGMAFMQMQGIPVRHKDLGDGSVSEVRRVSTGAVSGNLLEIPAGFSRDDPFGG